METMHAAYPSHPPLLPPPRLAESRPRSSFGQPTRGMQPADEQAQQLSAPASQESIISSDSYASSTASRLDSASNASQLTSYTEPTSPTSSVPTSNTKQTTTTVDHGVDSRDETPEDQTSCDADVDSLVSPTSIPTPVATNGIKKTAENISRDTLDRASTPMIGPIRGNRSRAASTASSSSSRAGELAANLKARLGYAMTKVQNGWEHKSFSEVEQLAAQKAANRHSMSHLESSRRPLSSGLSNGTARLSMHEPHNMSSLDAALSTHRKRLSASYTSYTSYAPSRAPHTTATTPRLQPAPDIRPANNYRSHPYAPPVQRSKQHNNVMSPPRTPITQQPRRPHPIRTDTQTAEAERDALQALFQLGSPHASHISRAQTTSRASSSQESPLRTEFATPRRVTFARSRSTESIEQASDSADSVHESRNQALDSLENK
ncbi:hypothetical protein Q7P37_000065 [Cladosporium fusiforme]